ncbi:hypothetical protein GUJ93_ZPchr0008g12949 [Zizania palustris]|uniref:Uncharacterized protein n=1 Tax=Zizania palustris TaxID=103762 RepID=A0A8J5V4N0_ZIZPA|nr:hypothetical protein GUJ93_ZPchr0008g12949 [Zizania palustris]
MMSSTAPPDLPTGDGDSDMEMLHLTTATASDYVFVASTFNLLLSASPPPPTPIAFPLSPASSSFVDPSSYADVAASSLHSTSTSSSASPRSVRGMALEYTFITSLIQRPRPSFPPTPSSPDPLPRTSPVSWWLVGTTGKIDEVGEEAVGWRECGRA